MVAGTGRIRTDYGIVDLRMVDGNRRRRRSGFPAPLAPALLAGRILSWRGVGRVPEAGCGKPANTAFGGR